MKWWIKAIPNKMVQTFASPYVGGVTIEDGLNCALDLKSKGLCSTLDLLGEGIQNDAKAVDNMQTYLTLIEHAKKEKERFGEALRPTFSVKPSAFAVLNTNNTDSTDYKDNAADEATSHALIQERIKTIVKAAHEAGFNITIDMEDRHWTDFTLKLFNDLKSSGFDNVGIVLQTRLNRTEKDINTLPQNSRVRLVIGIYDEPDDVDIDNKRLMKQRLIDYSKLLLNNGHRIEFATHDEKIINDFFEDLDILEFEDKSRIEFQMLYGVPRQKLHRKILDKGYKMRLYVPFAKDWESATAYLRRRLDEYPKMMLLVAKNILDLNK